MPPRKEKTLQSRAPEVAHGVGPSGLGLLEWRQAGGINVVCGCVLDEGYVVQTCLGFDGCVRFFNYEFGRCLPGCVTDDFQRTDDCAVDERRPFVLAAGGI